MTDTTKGIKAVKSKESPPFLVIEPGRFTKNYWQDLWRFRELLYFLAWRDIAVRYKQTALGVAWALLRPALTMLVFVGFRRVAGLHSASAPDPIFVFAGVLPWQFFSSALSDASQSLIVSANLISKIYIPRLLIPTASVATSLTDFFVTLGMVAVLMMFYSFAPSWQILALPLFTLLAFCLSLGSGLLLAALNVEYRDFRYIVPFIVQFGLFVSPVAFKTSDVPEQWRLVYSLNPMVGVIDGFRWAILGRPAALDWRALGFSLSITAFLLIFGVSYFRHLERNFADVI